MIGRILCLLGLHKTFLSEPGGPEVRWARIGEQYVGRCSRCHKETEPFTLTREMLP